MERWKQRAGAVMFAVFTWNTGCGVARSDAESTLGHASRVAANALIGNRQPNAAGAPTCGRQSGWFFQNPRPTSNDWRAVAALPSGTVVAVGAAGTILRTTDGGGSWCAQSS